MRGARRPELNKAADRRRIQPLVSGCPNHRNTMNHLTFNDDLAPFKDASFPDACELAAADPRRAETEFAMVEKSNWREIVPDLLAHESRAAQIFEYECPPADKLNTIPNDFDIMDLLDTEKNLLPFRRLRINMIEDIMGLGRSSQKMWLKHDDAGLSALVVVKVQGIRSMSFLYHIKKGSRRIDAIMTLAEKVMIPHTNLWGVDGSVADGWFRALAWFIREYMSPQNFVAKVSPDKKGKTVEWLESRTHYVLLNRNHPANSKTAKRGSKISPGDEYIKKRAHSRRAHARILRSPRFKNKVGQTIRVKACWVGPDEWRQFGSIYRMAKFDSANREIYEPKSVDNHEND
jgi:hypothetical protein